MKARTMRDLENKLKLLHRYVTAEERSLPDFFIAGTQKGGTTSLYAYLSQHPNVIAAFKKEVHFFESPVARKKGVRWYKSHFPKIAEKKAKNAITGEATPLMYSFYTPRLIQEVIPDVKLIFLLRDPTKRAFSHYKHNTRRAGREELTFSEAIREEQNRIEEDVNKLIADAWHDDRDNRRYSYVHRGFYAEQLERWYKVFPGNQIYVEESEYFYKDPQDCLNKVTDFLGIPRYQFDCNSSHNVGGYSESMPESDLRYLKELYKGQSEQLFKISGKKLWKDKNVSSYGS